VSGGPVNAAMLARLGARMKAGALLAEK